LALTSAAPFVVGALYGYAAITRGDRTGWVGLLIHLAMTIVAIVLPITRFRGHASSRIRRHGIGAMPADPRQAWMVVVVVVVVVGSGGCGGCALRPGAHADDARHNPGTIRSFVLPW
jgi:hypothetical protein